MWADFIGAGKELLVLFIAFAGGYIYRAVLTNIADEKDKPKIPPANEHFLYDKPWPSEKP